MANAFMLEPMTPASIAMYGSAPGFDFTGGTMPAGATLTRASGATRTRADGLIESVGNDVARFDYDPVTHNLRGLLIEAAATNALANSNDFAAAWGGSGRTITPNARAAPDGTNTASRIDFGATGRLERYDVPAGPNDATLWVYMPTPAPINFGFYDGGNASGVTSPTTPPANTWVRLERTSALSSSDRRLWITETGSAFTFYVWEAQCEAGTSATSNIHTTGTAGARAADQLTLNWASKNVADGNVTIEYTFDDGSTQAVSAVISGGLSAVPTNLNRSRIRMAKVTSGASLAPDIGSSTNLLNDYAGIIAQTACGLAPDNAAVIALDFGGDVSIDTMMLFGVELFPATGALTVRYATAAQGNFTGAFGTSAGAAYASSAPMTSGKGVALWYGPAPITARYVQLVFAAGAPGKSIRASRLVIGRRIQFERNFGMGGNFGVRDLGSLDFSARGVLARRRGKKLRTVAITFSHVRKDELEASLKPLIEHIGNTEMIALLLDPAEHPQRQNRAYYGPLVGDLGAVQRNSAAFESKINQVSIF